MDMGSTRHQGSERGTHREHASREEMADRIARALPEDGAVEPLKGLHLNRYSIPTEPLHAVSKPSFCVIAQGSKEVLLGDSLYRYDPAHYLLATVELPVVGQVVEASAERPYLSLRLDLDPALVGSVMVEAGHLSSRNGGDVRALDVSPLDAELLDATVRLVRLLDSPAEERVLRPSDSPPAGCGAAARGGEGVGPLREVDGTREQGSRTPSCPGCTRTNSHPSRTLCAPKRSSPFPAQRQ
ncbi:MAG: AraC family transcriptional regulator [Thermoanaerobaculia bacterium]